MVAVTLHEEKKTYIPCPDCGSLDTFRIDHLFEGVRNSFGPWACKHCGVSIKGNITKDNSVTIELIEGLRQRQGLMLIQITYDGYEDTGKKPIYLIFDQPIYTHNLNPDGSMKEDINDYWVNEHTCPTNIWRALAIIVGDDTDCHGILKHIQTVFKPDNFDEDNLQYDDWSMIFDRLPNQTIEGSGKPMILIGNST
jgi:ribosomal protein L37AE/L43A